MLQVVPLHAVPNQGDSGGGAICRDDDNNPFLCGIVSNVGEAAICDRNTRRPLNLREGEALPAGNKAIERIKRLKEGLWKLNICIAMNFRLRLSSCCIYKSV